MPKSPEKKKYPYKEQYFIVRMQRKLQGKKEQVFSIVYILTQATCHSEAMNIVQHMFSFQWKPSHVTAIGEKPKRKFDVWYQDPDKHQYLQHDTVVSRTGRQAMHTIIETHGPGTEILDVQEDWDYG